MENSNNKIKIEFAPGCFDNFEGTQEELEELIAEISRMAESGELFDQVHSLNEDELPEDVLEELHNRLGDLFGDGHNTSTPGRLLN